MRKMESKVLHESQSVNRGLDVEHMGNHSVMTIDEMSSVECKVTYQ
jgi:hypothetical protein